VPDVVFNLREARAALSKLVDRVAAGEEIVIAKAGRPVARLVPMRSRVERRTPGAKRRTPWAKRRTPGAWAGRVRVSEDFDATLPERLQAAFEGRAE